MEKHKSPYSHYNIGQFIRQFFVHSHLQLGLSLYIRSRCNAEIYSVLILSVMLFCMLTCYSVELACCV